MKRMEEILVTSENKEWKYKQTNPGVKESKQMRDNCEDDGKNFSDGGKSEKTNKPTNKDSKGTQTYDR